MEIQFAWRDLLYSLIYMGLKRMKEGNDIYTEGLDTLIDKQRNQSLQKSTDLSVLEKVSSK